MKAMNEKELFDGKLNKLTNDFKDLLLMKKLCFDDVSEILDSYHKTIDFIKQNAKLIK